MAKGKAVGSEGLVPRAGNLNTIEKPANGGFVGEIFAYFAICYARRPLLHILTIGGFSMRNPWPFQGIPGAW